MYIKEILNQHRRDFTAIFKCEHCGDEVKRSGYDDCHFHCNVIPQMECTKCGEVAARDYVPLDAKYPDDLQV